MNPNFTTSGVGTWKAQVVDGNGQVSAWYPFQVVTAVLTAPTAPLLSKDPPIWDTTPPAAPALYLHWTASSGNPAPLYDLYRNGTLVSAYGANLSQTSFYNELGLLLGQTYTYYVIAHNSAGSTQSNTISVTIPANLGTSMPGIPTGLIASPTSATSIQLTWTAVSDPGVTYLVYRAASPSGPWTMLQGNVAQASFDNVYSVQPSSTYYYEVASCNAGGTSGLSAWVSKTTPTLVKPSAPTIVSALAVGTNQIVLMWTGVLSAGQYILERADSTNGSYKTVQTFDVGTTSYTDTLTAPSTVSTTYSYRIHSLVNGVSSDPSSVVQRTLAVPVNTKPVSSGTLPPLTSAPNDIAQVYLYNDSAWTLEDTPAKLQDIKWSHPTIILTHGWNDGFDPDPNGVVPSDNYIQKFATTFFKLGSGHSVSAFNVLAVNWDDRNGTTVDGSLGSDPNHSRDAFFDMEDLALSRKNDAVISANNGIAAAKPLADKLLAAGMQPANVMLIGHSNGAGFMASLAEESHKISGSEIQELAALDAPVETRSYSEVIAAANVVGRIDNYFISLRPQTPLVIQDSVFVLSFGAPMFSTAGQITNFALSYSGGNAHLEITDRYAHTAWNYDWGFATSDFINPATCSAFDGYPVWEQTTSSKFEPFKPGDNDILAFQKGVAYAEAHPVAAIVGYWLGGAILNLLPSDNPWIAGISAGETVQICTFGLDNAIVVTNKAVNPANIVGQSFTSTINTLTNIAVSGASFLATGVHSLAQQSLDTVANWFGFAAQSPTFTSLAINVPQNAAHLTFDLTVTDPGNNDQLLVGIGNNVIGQVDLASVQQSGTQTFQLPIGQYAGMTNQTLTFYMPSPSNVTSNANFTLGNVQVESLAVDTAPNVSDVAQGVGVGGTLTFTAANFTAAFIDPDGDSLQKVMVTSLPQHGTLKLGGTAVTLDQEIPIASLGTLTFIPTTNYIGLDSFGWNASDGSLYAVGGANVDLTVNAVWTAVGGGAFTWGTTSNWQGGIVPGVAGDAALFGGSVGSGSATVTLDAPRSLSSLTFSPATGGSYALSGSSSNSLQFANGGNSASIVVTSGASSIAAPVVLGDNLNVVAAMGTSLTISDPISETGGSLALTLSGGGKLTLSGPNTFTGGIVVTAGTLKVTIPAAIHDGSNLTVGSAAMQVFAASPAIALGATPISTNLTAAPSSMPISGSTGALPVPRQPALSTPASQASSPAYAAVLTRVLPPRRIETGRQAPFRSGGPSPISSRRSRAVPSATALPPSTK